MTIPPPKLIVAGDEIERLRVQASRMMPRDLAPKFDPSDIVQNTLLEAHRDREQFRGTTTTQYEHWMAAILRNTLRRMIRQFRRSKKREVRRERLDGVEEPASTFFRNVPVSTATPGAKAADREILEVATVAIGRLSPEHRDVIKMRNTDKLGWMEIGQQLGRTESAARGLWYRAIESLRTELAKSIDLDKAR